MSYMDRLAGVAVSTVGQNGRPRTSTGQKSVAYSPEELVVWAILELAIDDTAILCRYGLIDREGELREWPKVRKRDTRYQDTWQLEPMRIAGMHDGLDHQRLRHFWLHPAQAQLLCNACGCRLPAKDIWKSILKNHAK